MKHEEGMKNCPRQTGGLLMEADIYRPGEPMTIKVSIFIMSSLLVSLVVSKHNWTDI